MSDFEGDRQLKTVVATAADLNQATGTVILTYTAPLGKTALVTYMAFDEKVGVPTMGLFWLRSANKIEIDRFTSDVDQEVRIALESGDEIRWEIIVDGGASAEGDFLISVEERGSNRP